MPRRPETSLSGPSPESLRAALQELDGAGSEEFLGRVLAAVDKVARYRRHRDLLEPEEARQELLAWLLEHPEQLWEWSAKDRSPGYLWTVFRNRAVDIIRARHGRRRPPAEPEAEPRGLEEVLFGAEEDLLVRPSRPGQRSRLPAALIAPSTEDVYLDSLIPSLPGISAEEMRLLALRHVYGWTAPELAAEIGITPAAMRQRLSRAREKVREAVSHSRRSVPMFVVEGPPPGTQDEDEDHGTDHGRRERAA